ncbi:MAG: sulfotransferase [Rhodobacteraceae bacterium]|nr:sulfotransferase [Paracoccaceae bacterium]
MPDLATAPDLPPATQAPPDIAQVARLIAAGAFDAGLALLSPHLKAGRPDHAVLDCAATCYWHLGDHDTALTVMGMILRAWPSQSGAWAKLGSMAMTLGDRDGARTFLEKALSLDPAAVRPLVALNLMRPFAPDSHRARKLRSLARLARLTPADRADVLNGLGRVAAAAGQHRAAMHHFGRAKAQAPGDFDPRRVQRTVADQIRLVPRAVPAATGAWPRMVFVVGMPRSGTTLVDAILSRHSKVRSLGESPALPRVARRIVASGEGDWDWIARTGPGELAARRAEYLAIAGLADAAPTDVVVDKMPLNCLRMGLAQRLFPDARFIFMHRHPLDNGLSNYMVSFHETHGFTKNLEWIGEMSRAVHLSMADYAGKMGNSLRVQSFRALVEAPGSQIPGLIAHAGLTWEAACLSPEAGRQPVHTASVMQVREKINTKGLDRWKTYATYLDPLIAGFGGQESISAWEAADRMVAGTGRYPAPSDQCVQAPRRSVAKFSP